MHIVYQTVYNNFKNESLLEAFVCKFGIGHLFNENEVKFELVAQYGNVRLLEWCFQPDNVVYQPDKWDKTVCYSAAYAGNCEVLKWAFGKICGSQFPTAAEICTTSKILDFYGSWVELSAILP